MQPNVRKTTLKRILAGAVTTLMVLLAAGLGKTFAGGEKSGERATYSHGVLRVVIPFHAVQPGAGRLTVEVLDPENHVIGHTERPAEVARGASQFRAEMKLDKPVPLDELVWHRVRYEFRYDDSKVKTLEGVDSISDILRLPVLRVLGQRTYLAGSKAAVRVIVRDATGDVIPGRGAVRIALEAEGKQRRTLFTGPLNHRGTTEAKFQFPEGVTGSYNLHYTVDTSVGASEYRQAIRMQDKVGILLTTDKTMYQPGQMIHVRALALDRADHRAAGKRNLLFEVEDSHGNKVFKKGTTTDEFGIGAADFGLASEVNLGTYHVRAILGEASTDSLNSAEIALDVEKYVLPKFKVELNFATSDGKKKHGYRPGDHVSGTVQANYFFGKALDGAEVSVKAEGMDVTTFTAAAVEGKTDHDGAYHFDLRLPDYLAGRPLDKGAAKVLMEAAVKDTAGHSESRGEPITVSESAFLLTAVPEGGMLVPGLENQVFLLASYPDGTPVQASLRVRSKSGEEQNVTTDAGGLAVITLKKPQKDELLQIDGTDKEGEKVSEPVPLQARTGEEQVLLRADKAVYRAADLIRLRILATKKRGTVYIDVVKDGQTVLTRDLDIAEGQAELTLRASPDLAGTVDVDAYLFSQNAQPVADHRLVFVQPADELKVETVADRAAYKPGDDSHIRFHVTDKNGEGVCAALGLQIVDEAVFALAEKKPGFAKVFFYLEQEVMKPRYEIHSVGLPEIIEPVSDDKEAQRDIAARALFSATEIVRQNRFDGETGREIPRTKYDEYWNRYQAQFLEDAKKIAAELRHAIAGDPKENDLEKVFKRLADSGKPEFRDAWRTRLRIERSPWDNSRTMFMIHGAGPDKSFDTADDLRATLYFRRSPIVTTAAAGGTKLRVRIEHDSGANNHRAKISGLVIDPSGAVIPDAVITITNMTISDTQVAHTNPSGEFHASALRPGIYRVTVSSHGFRQAEDTFQLKARDRAEVSARLEVGAVSEMVEVSANSVVVLSADASVIGESRGFGAGEAGGVAGGMIGGVMGGVIGGQRWRAVPAPKRVPMMLRALSETGRKVLQTATVDADDNETAEVHVRSYFPETLYINPEIITDRHGIAEISVPLADNITTWRMSMIASTERGTLGTATSSLKVFQDFFVDLDLPMVLTEGDQVSLPVAIYNYTEANGEVRLKLKDEDWFRLVDDSVEKSVNVDAQHVGGSQFTLEAKRIGKFKLTLTAQMKGGSSRADVVVREMEVVPNGREQNIVFNGQLESTVSHRVEFPTTAINGASKIVVRLYPGPLSQIIEGMDSILRMPSGCFEQTSSSTYPNVLALDYMKRTKKLTPEVHAKAEGYIANGYQRLLTFEVQSGGFSWFGQAPANKILTSYGLMEFYDMAKVHDVDARVIQRTQQWLASQQQQDGSWKPDAQFINEGATNRYNKDVLRITAYIAWSLGNTGYQGPAMQRAAEYIQKNLSEKSDPYTLAVLANFAVDSGRDPEFTRQVMQMLLDARTDKDEQVWWSTDETSVYGTGTSASVETTGLAVQALLKWGRAAEMTRKALAYLTARKDATGAWGSTQATIMALRALLLANEKGTADLRGNVEIVVNGKSAEKLVLAPENNDLLHQFVFKEISGSGSNVVEIRYQGKGTLGYQTAGQYFVPWDEESEEPLSISVNYDRTKLVQDDIVIATATLRNNLPKTANMVMVDLGIPPGFDLLSEDLQEYQDKSTSMKSGRLEKFNQTATQAILYFNSLEAGEMVQVKFRLRAKYPIRVRTFQSRVYEYYDPDIRSVARPIVLEVKKR